MDITAEGMVPGKLYAFGYNLAEGADKALQAWHTYLIQKAGILKEFVESERPENFSHKGQPLPLSSVQVAGGLEIFVLGTEEKGIKIALPQPKVSGD